uniref:Uncharacterized protein n=1 Tax=Anopheles atroparvus TaxID=41427 RepID=A0AAG5D0Z2_ANOAO
MEQIVLFIVWFSVIFTSVRVASFSTPSDIISGKEFLTLIMTPTNINSQSVRSSATTQHHHHQQQPSSFRGLRKFRHFFYKQREHGDSILPIEALFSSHEDMSLSSTHFYGNRKDQRQQQTLERYPQRPSAIIGSATVNTTLNSLAQPGTLQTNIDNGSDRTTLSFAELTGTTLATKTAESITKLISFGDDETFSTTEMPLEENTDVSERKEMPSVNFTEVSIGDQPLKPELVAQLLQSNVRDAKTSKAIKTQDEYNQAMLPVPTSNSHHSKLSIEELDPTVSKQKNDSVETESVVVPKLVANNYKESQSPLPGFSQQRYRMERKQDTKGTFQALIYPEGIESLKRPSSVSNRYIDQTAPTSKSWRDISDEYLPNRKRSSPNSHASTAVDINATDSMTSPLEVEPLTSMLQDMYSEPARFYSEPAQYYSEPAKMYSEPAKIYGESEKMYSQPARVYSEPAKVYSEPAKVYSEPAKVYSEPAKIYSQPSSYWQTAYSMTDSTTTKTTAAPVNPGTYVSSPGVLHTSTLAPESQQLVSVGSEQHQRQRLVFNELDKIPYDQLNAPTVGSDSDTIHNAIGKFVPKQSHTTDSGEEQATQKLAEALDPTGEASRYDAINQDDQQTAAVVQTLTPVAGSGDDSKVGYVVEGRNYRKYRVEEKTPDGFIVGEYGVLSHNDGNLRGVRYTADSDINPRLIYDALLKFLSL